MCVSCQVSSHGHESRIPVERIENIILPSCVAVHCAVGAAHGAMLRAPCWFMFGLETLLLRTALIHYCEIDDSRSGTAPSCVSHT